MILYISSFNILILDFLFRISKIKMSNLIGKETVESIEQPKMFYINKDIKHLRQLNQNDCGPTCLKMAVK